MTHPVFADPSGKRWRVLRRTALALGVVTTVITLALVGYLLTPPALPQFSEGVRTARGLAQLPKLVGTRRAREHEAERRRLLSSLERRPGVPALRPGALPVVSVVSQRPAATTGAEFAAFYVNWDDNAFASLRKHAEDIDWLVAEWAFVAAAGDSLQIKVDRRVPFLLSTLPANNRPRVLAMISNFEIGRASCRERV